MVWVLLPSIGIGTENCFVGRIGLKGMNFMIIYGVE